MSEGSDEYPYPEEEGSNIPPEKLLLLEYEQTNEEWRNYERLLNQSYYLAAIVFTFFLGALANLHSQQSHLLGAFIAAFAVVVFIVLGIAGRAYHQRRQSAARLRTQIAEELHELSDSKTPRVQKVIAGDGEVRIDNRRNDSDPSFWERYPIWKFTLYSTLLWIVALVLELGLGLSQI